MLESGAVDDDLAALKQEMLGSPKVDFPSVIFIGFFITWDLNDGLAWLD
jgi:hypothetical protein